MEARAPSRLPFLIIACATAIGIAGTDLVLPAVPSLPRALDGTAEHAQFVLSAFTGGAAIGLLLFGELGARIDQRRLLLGSLTVYGLASLTCAFSNSLSTLIILRFMQGAAGAAAAVFAPGMLRSIYGEARAVRALGALGSIEALAPALAPIAGAGLLIIWDWRASFHLLAGLALGLAVLIGWRMDLLPARSTPQSSGSYLLLLYNRAFLGHSLGYAFTLGGLLVFVFGAPSVFVNILGLGLGTFVAMQCCGILCFAVAANLAGRLCEQLGAMKLIWLGSAMACAGAIALLGYGLAGGTQSAVIVSLFTVLNTGLGLRGAPGFHAALQASGGDDTRSSALIVLAILATASLGTALVAPFISLGLSAIAGGAVLCTLLGLFALSVVPGSVRETSSGTRP
ncbi:MFS transporter [Sphingomonas sp.]|uniref:MFS transporter n=1 Tax=Sphingomonas sp. TaxID=28214 RepID=UPI0031D1A5CF